MNSQEREERERGKEDQSLIFLEMLLKKETEQQFLRPNHKASPPAGEKKALHREKLSKKPNCTRRDREQRRAERVENFLQGNHWN